MVGSCFLQRVRIINLMLLCGEEHPENLETTTVDQDSGTL